MKSILFWFCIIASCFGANNAFAVRLSQHGKGQVLIFPFFTAQNGWDTYIDLSLDGSTGESAPHALKVYIRDGVDGEIVNGFNIYSNADPDGDYGVWNWRASISKTDSGTVLTIAEGTCTISDQRIGGAEGYQFPIETDLGIIEVYAISRGIEYELRQDLLDCQVAVDRWNPLGEWRDDPNNGLVNYNFSHDISGNATLINVSDGISVNYRATALQEFAEEIPHSAPFAIGGFFEASPTLADAEPVAVMKNGIEWAPESGEGIDAVKAVLSELATYNALTNQVITAPEVGARTDWILSYPLTGYTKDRPFEAQINGDLKNCDTFGLYLYESVDEQNSTLPLFEIGATDAHSTLTSWGQGGWKGSFGIDITPEPTVNVEAEICNAVNVANFGNQESIFLASDSPNLYTIEEDHLAGDSSTTLRWHLRSREGNRSIVTGFAVTIFTNGTLNNGITLANYGILRPHE